MVTKRKAQREFSERPIILKPIPEKVIKRIAKKERRKKERKSIILIRRLDGKFQRYKIKRETQDKNYNRKSLTKADRKETKRLKGKRIYYEKKAPKYTKWVGLEMGVHSRADSLKVFFGFESDRSGRPLSDIKAFEKAIKNIEHIDKSKVSGRQIQMALDESTEQGWLDASDDFVYNAMAHTEEPPKRSFFVYDGKNKKKLIFDTRSKNWNFRTDR